MKVADPNIRVIAVGADDPEWDLEVMKTAGKYIDYISNHQYLGSDDYYETVASVYWVEKRLRILGSVIEIAQPSAKEEERVKIAFDEWNIHYRSTPENGNEENYALKDGLFAAGVFVVLHRLCRSVTTANLAQLVNVLGAIHMEKHGLYLTPIYWAFELFVNHSGSVALDTFVRSERYDIEGEMRFGKAKLRLQSVPYLDASGTLAENENRLYLAVVNYQNAKDIQCPVVLDGFSPSPDARIYELNGPDVMAVNGFDSPDRIRIKDKTVKNIGPAFSYTFPAHSATIMELRVA